MSAPTDLFAVAGKTAVVTGGSRGIGFMIARGLVAAGVDVVISARKAGPCQEAAERLGELGTCQAIPADLSTEDGARTLAAAVRERFGVLNILVNNAGATWGAPLEEFPDSAWDKVLDTNVRGIFQQGLGARGARHADDHRVDELQVARVRRHRDHHLGRRLPLRQASGDKASSRTRARAPA